MFKTIGVLAHVDAGKTTFSEQLLFHTKSIMAVGRVDHQAAFLDYHTLERARGITIFAEHGRFQIEGDTYTLIDTPGHVDFSAEMERAIRAMDYAVLIVSAVEGIQGHTETVWQLLRTHHVPTYLFINKVDREGADVLRVMQELKQQFSPHIVLYEEAAEFVAERDEELLAQFMEDSLSEETVFASLRQLIKEEEIFLAMSGAALKGHGIQTFLDVLHNTTITDYDVALPFQAEVMKIRHGGEQRLTFCKALQGELTVRTDVAFGETREKVTEIRLYNGNSYQAIQRVTAGEIFAVKGLSVPQIGDYIGTTFDKGKPYTLVPTMQAKVVYNGTEHIKEVLRLFRLVEAEEPTLKVQWQEAFQTIYVHMMGVIQLEVLKELLYSRFQLSVQFEDPEILYEETICTTVTGYGHFEPLKHYAEVHLQLEPNERGVGITFFNACHVDDLTIGHQRLIEQHVLERAHRGLLTGSAVTDIHVTLLTGAAHNKHTDGGDFREATYRALRQGLEQAENVLLEPYYAFKLKAASEHIGRMMTDIQQASGTFDAPIITETDAILTGQVPVATFMNYPTTFLAYTNGKGVISLTFAGYDVCHNTAEVMERIGYNKDADPEYTSSSIFCSKGKGYSVPWQEVKAHMHKATL
ncbi:translation factor GTPase family protein [Lysinibacillus sp. KU-BSD001]|uniref:GTP-binding protein n=1 Tax=Lysinibacillus sp. KU-BSD001 TaxID=3141328 RepID=UPI0036E48B6F